MARRLVAARADLDVVVKPFPPHSIVAIDTLTPYTNNARTHTDAQIKQIAASIEAFGFTNPVLVDAAGGIIAGHGRVLAAKMLGLKEVPIIELAHLSETQRRAYVITDNKLALNAGWDMELLQLELSELDSLGFDLDLTGFSGDELEAMSAPEIDPETIWEGMPDFQQPDKMAYRSIVVHFRDDAAAAQFAQLLGQSIGPKTKFLWYPEAEKQRVADIRYAS